MCDITKEVLHLGKKHHYSLFFKVTAASAIVASIVIPIETTNAMSDVPSNHQFYDAIKDLQERGIISGYADGTFKPEKNLTRGQAAKILASVLKLDTINVQNPNFKDIPTTHQYYGAIAALKEANIIDGFEDGTFKPENNVQRNHLAKILANAMNLKATNSANLPLTDVHENYRESIAALYENGVTKGKTETTFDGSSYVTRGQMAAFIIRAEKNIAQTQKFPFEYVDTSKNTLKPSVHGNWAASIKDYIFDNNDNTFSTLEVDKNIKITTYDSQSKKLSEKTLALELPLFGAFYSGETCNYIAYGQNNPNEENIEVIRIVKYDKNFKRIAATTVKGDEIITVIPFDASSGGRIAEQGNTLVFHSSRERYKSSDGLNHQSQLTFEINTSSMEIINTLGEFQGNHVSHSFDQYVLMDGEAPVYLDHGDAYPRSLVLHKLIDASSNKKNRYSKKEFFPISGGVGDNVTGVSIGGFEQSPTHYLAAFNSVNQNKQYHRTDTRNVYLYGIPKDFSNKNDASIIETTIANYENTALSTTTPTIVKITDDKFVVLWQEYLDDKIGSLKYVYVNGQGKTTSSTHSAVDMELSTVQPIVKNNKIIWYTTSNNKKVMYELEIE